MKNNQGFTLMETIISLGIFAVILLVLFYLFDGYQSTFNSQQALVNAAGSARLTLNQIQTHALQASQVLATSTIAGTSYSSGTSTLILLLPSRDSAGDIVNNASDYAVFYTVGKKVYRQTQADPASSRTSELKQLTDVLSGLTFTYDNPDFSRVNKITVDLATDATSGNSSRQVQLREDIYLRNK